MAKEIINLNEQQLKAIVAESVKRILKESDLDEGFWDNMKAGFQGAKQGFNAQKNLDRGSDNFKYEHDYEDMKRDANPFRSKSQNTAQEQANELLNQAKYYQTKANQLRATAQQITAKYGLVKTAVNKRVNGVQVPQAAHNTTIATARNNTNGYGKGRNPNNINQAKQTGLWGA